MPLFAEVDGRVLDDLETHWAVQGLGNPVRQRQTSFPFSSSRRHGDGTKDRSLLVRGDLKKVGVGSQNLLSLIFKFEKATMYQINANALWEKLDKNSATAFVYNFFKLAGPKITTCCGTLSS